MKIEANELRIGNWLQYYKDGWRVGRVTSINKKTVTINNWASIKYNSLKTNSSTNAIEPIVLTEDILIKGGFILLDENSAGKRYGLLNNNVFDRVTILIIWKNNQRAGKIFRGNKEIKYVHKLQNLIFELTDRDLEINL